MKMGRFSKEQIIGVLKEHQAGLAGSETLPNVAHRGKARACRENYCKQQSEYYQKK
jgi:hypothetical protein